MKTIEVTDATYTAFEGTQLYCRGSLDEVVRKVKAQMPRAAHNSEILIFSDATGKTMDFNFQGTERDVLKRLQLFTAEIAPKEVSGPGRPKLGVMSREVSLLPRHWEWLATQSGGASAVLRKLVEEAKAKSSGSTSVKQAQERSYKFMSVLAGDLPGFEDALRALYRRDQDKFLSQISGWPHAVRDYAHALAQPAFTERASGKAE